MSVVWCDPPEAAKRPWRERLEPLKERPRRWARVAEYDAPQPCWHLANALRRGRYSRPDGLWEFRTRQIETDKPGWGVWARYLGPDDG